MNNKLFWKILFFVYLTGIIITSAMSMILFFILPDIPVTITLSAKYWIVFIFGGIGKQFMAGFFMYYSYRKWQKTKEEAKA